MIDTENIKTAVVKGLKEYLGCPVIRNNQNVEPPSYPYVSFTVTTPKSENKGTYGEYSDGKARKPVKQRWSITSQSDKEDESVTLANKAAEWLDYVGTIYLYDNGVIVESVTAVTNRDNVLTVEYEYKNGFDCFFSCYDEVVSNIATTDEIASVEIDNTEVQNESLDSLNALLEQRLDGEI